LLDLEEAVGRVWHRWASAVVSWPDHADAAARSVALVHEGRARALMKGRLHTEVLLEARRWSPETRVIVFTGIDARGKIAELVEIGADGIFCKGDDMSEVIRAIPHILAGGRVVCSRFTVLLEEAGDIEPLTDRERQVLSQVVAGKTNREIGEALGISIKTVDRHRTNVMGKTGSRNAAELIAHALREGLIDQNAS